MLPASNRLPNHISLDMHSELAPCALSTPALASPPATPPRGHKHSFSKPMSWLNRSSSSTSNRSSSLAAPKPYRISEPRVPGSMERCNLHRSGQLGSGATIVRTPQEALSSSTHGFGPISEDRVEQDASSEISQSIPPPSSPPLPPLPDIPEPEEGDRLSGTADSPTLADHVAPSCPPFIPSPAAKPSSSRPAMPARACAPIPAEADPIPPQPPFEVVLLSPVPDGAIDPSKLIVTLETCITTYRTSLRSLVSRPSRLSNYITSLLTPVSETASIYSNVSDASSVQHANGFGSVFRDHLAPSSFHSQSFTGIHVFLDRPSAPYVHVLDYLRSVPGTPDHPEALPRAVQLESASSSRIESLRDLRDEANYLGLAELEALCAREIQRFQRPPFPATAVGTPPRGQTGSVHSSHTLVERGELRPSESLTPKGNGGGRTAKTATRESSPGSSFEHKDGTVRERGRQGKGVKHEVSSPPPGWI